MVVLEGVGFVERGIARAPALRRAKRMGWSCILGREEGAFRVCRSDYEDTFFFL